MTSRTQDIDDWMKTVSIRPLLTEDQVISLATKIQSLPESDPQRKKLVNKLVEHNLRLVPYFVKKFLHSSTNKRWNGDDTVDFLQAGALGLVRAAELYDPKRGYSFVTYAQHWIKSKITRYNLSTLSSLTVPEDNFRRAYFYKKHGYLVNKRTGKQVDDKEAREFVKSVENARLTLSFDIRKEDGDSYCPLHEVVGDSSFDVEESEFCNHVMHCLSQCNISERGISILIDYYMLGKSMKSIGERFGITASKVCAERDLALRLARRQEQLFMLFS